MKPLIVYHANCFDGYGAAWAAWRKFGEGAEYVPAKYGDPFPREAHGRDVYILDFSWTPEAFRRAIDAGIHPRQIAVWDHHQTAQEDARADPVVTSMAEAAPPIRYWFDLQKSGATMAWEGFHPGVATPRLLQYVEDRDLWRFALPRSREVSAWLRSWPQAFDRWNRLADQLNRAFERVAREGSVILRYQSQLVDAMCEAVRWRELGGYRVPYVNATVLNSECGERLLERYPEVDCAAYYTDRGNGKRQWGLRARAGFDCSAIARRYGGGGHPHAAGFVEDLP